MAKHVLNLDLLRPEGRIVMIAGKEVDLSFIPCGIVFDVNDAVMQLDEIVREVGQVKMLAGGKEAGRAFDVMIKLCAIVTECQHPELTEEFLRRNLSVKQLELLAEEIKDLLARELAQIPGGDGEKKRRRDTRSRAAVRGNGDTLPVGDEGVPPEEHVTPADSVLPQRGGGDEISKSSE